MKRFLIRLSALTGVVILGLIAIAQAQRAVNPTTKEPDSAAKTVASELSMKPVEPAAATPGNRTAPENRTTTTSDPFSAVQSNGPLGRSSFGFTTPKPTDSTAAATTAANSSASNTTQLPPSVGNRYSGSELPSANIAFPTVPTSADGQPTSTQPRPMAASGFGAMPPERAATGTFSNDFGNDPPARYAPGSIGSGPGSDFPTATAIAPTSATGPTTAIGIAPDRPTGYTAGLGERYPDGSQMLGTGGDPAAIQPVTTATEVPQSLPGGPADEATRPASAPQGANVPPQAGEPGRFGLGTQPSAPTTAGVTAIGKPGMKQLEGLQTPSLTVEKSAPPEVQIGKAALFAVRVRNSGSVPARSIEIHDRVPQGTRLLSTNPAAAQGPDGQLVWTVGALEPGGEIEVQMELMPTAEGEIGSVASVHFSAQASVRTVATRPGLTLDVQAPSRVMVDEDVTLAISVSNPGSGVATGVLITERVPPALEHPAGLELEYDVGDLQPGETRQLQLTMKATKPGRVVNLLAAQGDGQLQTQTETELEIIAPALAVNLEGPKRRYLDRKATYTVSVSNPGTAMANEVELVTYLSKGLQFLEANNAGEYDPKTHAVYWLLEELPAGEVGSVQLTTLPVEPGEQSLRVESTAQRGLSANKEEAVVVEGVAAILFQVVDVADPVEVNGETTYEIRVINQGSKEASNIQLLALLPEGMRAVSAEGPTRHAIDTRQVRFDPLSRLAPKADTTYQIRAQALAPGDLRLRVQLLTDEMNTPVTKEESTRVYSDE